MVKIKTLIELFDTCQVENAIAGMRFNPEKIVFVGFKKIMTKKKMEDLRNFFDKRAEGIEIEFEIVSSFNFDAIVEKFNYIIDNNEDCGFDLTGGKELVLAAIGAVSEQRGVPMFQINVRDGSIIAVRNYEITDSPKSVMTIEEAIELHGCSIVRGSYGDARPEITEDLKKELDILWEICTDDFRLWNKQCSAFTRFEKFIKAGTLYVDAEFPTIEDKEKILLDEVILKKLKDNGLICDCDFRGTRVSFRYKNDMVHGILTKAGNVLELYSFMILNEIAQENPGYYDDIDIGIFVDWDGVTHCPYEKVADTQNEIDVIVMRDLVPIFISCKNGEADKSALYELETVAGKFGGKYAKKAMIASYVSADKGSKAHIVQRAKDMGITLIVVEDLPDTSKAEFKKRLKNMIV